MSVAAFSKLFVDIIYAGLDKLPNPGEEIYSQGFDIQLGGGAALLPIVLNRLNVPSKLGTFLANDLPSKIARELLSDLNFTTFTMRPLQAPLQLAQQFQCTAIVVLFHLPTPSIKNIAVKNKSITFSMAASYVLH